MFTVVDLTVYPKQNQFNNSNNATIVRVFHIYNMSMRFENVKYLMSIAFEYKVQRLMIKLTYCIYRLLLSKNCRILSFTIKIADLQSLRIPTTVRLYALKHSQFLPSFPRNTQHTRAP